MIGMLAGVVGWGMVSFAAAGEGPGFALHAMHYEAVKDLLGPRDMVFAFCPRHPRAGADGRPSRDEAPVWNEGMAKERLAQLNAIADGRVMKAVVFSTIEDLERMLERLPKGVTWVMYNSEPGMTPAEELSNHEASVKRFAEIAHGRGLKVGWGPTLMQLEKLADAPLANAKFVDRVGLQHQRVLQHKGLDAFRDETRRRAGVVRKHNPDCRVTAQVVIGRGSVEDCIAALRSVKDDVDFLSAWTMNDTDALRRIIAAVRGGAPAPAGLRAGGAPFGPFHLMPDQFGAPFSLVMAGLRTPEDAARVLDAARAKGMRVLIHLTRGRREFQNEDKSFSLDRFTRAMERFRGVDFSPWVKDGTLLGHMLFDEPHDPTNWDGKPVPFATIDAAAAASKRLWPDLPAAVGSPGRFLRDGVPYRRLDFSYAQYTVRRGDFGAWLREELAASQKAGLKPLLGLNVLGGGGPDQPLTAAQLREFGCALVREPACRGVLFWKWDESYFSRADIGEAIETVARARQPNAPDGEPPANPRRPDGRQK
jgi:hypothetical protein